jgi:hypothetical protein
MLWPVSGSWALEVEVALRHGLPGKVSHPGALVDPRDGWLQRNPFSWYESTPVYFPNAATVALDS